MSNVIIFTNDFGGVSTTIPTGEISIEAVLAKDCPEGAIIVDSETLPQGDAKAFYNAWELVDGTVVVNFSKAVELTKQRLRVERNPLLLDQDIAFQRALETNGDTTAIVAEKQRLRDITKLADSTSTLQELIALKCS